MVGDLDGSGGGASCGVSVGDGDYGEDDRTGVNGDDSGWAGLDANSGADLDGEKGCTEEITCDAT